MKTKPNQDCKKKKENIKGAKLIYLKAKDKQETV
jgi:hypothetical protein